MEIISACNNSFRDSRSIIIFKRKPTCVIIKVGKTVKTKRSRRNTLKDRLASLSLEGMMSDNAMISIYPLGKKYFCFYESPFIQHVDPITLETIDRLDLNKKLGIFSHASHPHYDHHGNMFTMGLKVGIGGPEYVINQFPKDTAEPFENGRIIAKVRPRWIFEPGYMHSFAITENYIILIEQPLTIDVMALAKGMIII